MARKIHMQDQAFNQVQQIMNHRYKQPLQLQIVGINITLAFPGDIDFKETFSKPLKSAAAH